MGGGVGEVGGDVGRRRLDGRPDPTFGVAATAAAEAGGAAGGASRLRDLFGGAVGGNLEEEVAEGARRAGGAARADDQPCECAGAPQPHAERQLLGGVHSAVVA